MIVLLLFLAIARLAHSVEILPYNPVASSKAVLGCGNARFTVLTTQLIRIEYSTSGTFEDRATPAIVNRNLALPTFTSSLGSVLSISTPYLTLNYTCGQPFSASSLIVKGTPMNTGFAQWTYGQTNSNSRNLLGTIRSLDELGHPPLNCTENADIVVHKESLHCEWGLVSRDGWALFDDSNAPVLDSNGWWAGTSVDSTDLYLFAHGQNYRQALQDFVLVGGRIAMPPRYVFGLMWSIWLDVNVRDSKKIIDDYSSRSLPLDVYILDMNWHLKLDWTGYTFDPHLFPYPQTFFAWLHRRGLASAANLHDDNGVASFEKMYPQMASACSIKNNQTVPFSVTNQTILTALEDIVLYDAEQIGMDFWWIDWQQGGTEGGASGGKQNPTIWLNHMRGTDHARRGENVRGVVLGRFGGMGNHRYQVGFSGDVDYLSWKNLAYQPYFSMTASNVGYGFWSHDLVGPFESYEMYTRWVQWIAFSGVFRSHDRGKSTGVCADTRPPTCSIVKVWEVSTKYFEANRDAMQKRSQLIPYIYSAVRDAFDTGLSIIRPLYYDFPQCNMAYAADAEGNYAEYMFGDDILVAPVVAPAKNSSMTASTIWIPPGTWIEDGTGVVFSNDPSGCGQTLTKLWDLRDIPIFVRAGAIIPTIPLVEGDTIGVAQRQYTTLVFNIYPGATSGSVDVYEDDGKTVDYLSGSYAYTYGDYSISGDTLTFKLRTEGQFIGQVTSRNIWIRLVNFPPPSSVNANGQAVPYSYFGGENHWTYQGDDVAVMIRLQNIPITTALTVSVVTPSSTGVTPSMLSGVKGGIVHAQWAKDNLDEAHEEPGSLTIPVPVPAYTSDLAALGDTLNNLIQLNDLNGYKNAVLNFPAMYQAAVSELATATVTSQERLAYSQALLANALN